MITPDFSLEAHGNGTFEIPQEGIQIRLNILEGTLEVHSQNGEMVSFPLQDGELPHEQALFLDKESQCLVVGTADFGNLGLFLREFPVNTGESAIDFRIENEGDFIGSVDIRDISRQMNIHFDFSKVPIKLSRTGNFLRITTLRCDTTDENPCWYYENATT